VSATPRSQTEHLATPERELLTYRQAAEQIGLSPAYIAHLVSQGVLHSIKLPGERQKYLRRNEVEWYGRRRAGSLEGNPYLTTKPPDNALQATQPLIHTNLGDLEPFTPSLTAKDMGDASLGMGAIVIVFLLAALLWSFLSQRRFDEEKLTQFRTAPQLEPWRRAIKQLASHLPDEPAA
jgi:hypothetical protein